MNSPVSSHTTSTSLVNASHEYASTHSPMPENARDNRRAIAAAFQAGYAHAWAQLTTNPVEAQSDEQITGETK